MLRFSVHEFDFAIAQYFCVPTMSTCPPLLLAKGCFYLSVFFPLKSCLEPADSVKKKDNCILENQSIVSVRANIPLQCHYPQSPRMTFLACITTFVMFINNVATRRCEFITSDPLVVPNQAKDSLTIHFNHRVKNCRGEDIKIRYCNQVPPIYFRSFSPT